MPKIDDAAARILDAQLNKRAELDLSGLGLSADTLRDERILKPLLACKAHLRKLDLSNNPLNELPRRIGWLKELQMLDLGNTGLSKLPEEIKNHENLTTLVLRNNKFNSSAESLANLPLSIGDLDLSENKITDSPGSLKGLKKLQSLNLSGNPLSQFSFKDMPAALAVLDLSNSGLLYLTDDIATMQQLKVLNLEANMITDLPRSIMSLPLQTINVVGNNLSDGAVKMLDRLAARNVDVFMSFKKEQAQNAGKDLSGFAATANSPMYGNVENFYDNVGFEHAPKPTAAPRRKGADKPKRSQHL